MTGPILYDPKTMNQLNADLGTHGGAIQNEIHTLQSLAQKFHDNLVGADATAAFNAKHKELNTALEDTLQRLKDLATKVDEALNRALATDKKVGAGFSG
ncbi:WXG100 family type VII secretion target [Nocardia sp. NBC_01499]|uniref:WXG100 family type VII secretion target n=1 Tax=Nocardia sp. NBC_01499 TaxID=2903597 RepID=UPI00386890F8